MSATERIDGRSAGVGVATGLAAFLLGYLVTYVTQRSSVEESLQTVNAILELFGSDSIPPAQAVGWVFYNAHFVDTEIDVFGQRTVNFIAESDGGSMTFLYAVPPILLVLAGVAVATYVAAEGPVAGAASGALVTLGYLPAAIAGRFAVTYTVGDSTVAPDLVTAVLLAGAVYPLALGAIGGAIAGIVATAR